MQEHAKGPRLYRVFRRWWCPVGLFLYKFNGFPSLSLLLFVTVSNADQGSTVLFHQRLGPFLSRFEGQPCLQSPLHLRNEKTKGRAVQLPLTDAALRDSGNTLYHIQHSVLGPYFAEPQSQKPQRSLNYACGFAQSTRQNLTQTRTLSCNIGIPQLPFPLPDYKDTAFRVPPEMHLFTCHEYGLILLNPANRQEKSEKYVRPL